MYHFTWRNLWTPYYSNYECKHAYPCLANFLIKKGKIREKKKLRNENWSQIVYIICTFNVLSMRACEKFENGRAFQLSAKNIDPHATTCCSTTTGTTKKNFGKSHLNSFTCWNPCVKHCPSFLTNQPKWTFLRSSKVWRPIASSWSTFVIRMRSEILEEFRAHTISLVSNYLMPDKFSILTVISNCYKNSFI